MADTARTRADLLALLPDNVGKLISPQDMRDVIVSTFGGYGGIGFTGLTNTGQGLSTSFADVEGWDVQLEEDPQVIVDGQIANDRLVLGLTGVYFAIAAVSVSLDSAATLIARLARAGTNTVPGSYTQRSISSAGDVGAFACTGLVVPTGANQTLSLQFSVSAGTPNIDGISGCLIAWKIG